MKNKIIIFGIVSAFSFSPVRAATETICQGQNNICGNKIEKFNFGYTAEQVNRMIIDAVKAHDARADVRHKADAETIKQLTTAVTALAQGKTKATKSQVEAAFAALRKGDFTLALSLFEEEAENLEEEEKTLAIQQKSLDELKEKNRKNQVTTQLNIGALAFLYDTQKSLKAYRRATQLDPDNADGWNRLGHLLDRIGELDEAINAYQTVLRLGQAHKDQEGIAIAYGNLGIVYRKRGDLDKAVEYYNKSLEINERLGRKEGMAIQYNNLAALYETKQDYKKARAYWEKSLALFQALSSPNAKKVQGFLDRLPR